MYFVTYSGPKRRRKSAPIVVSKYISQYIVFLQLWLNFSTFFTPHLADDSKITGPMRLRSYYAVAAYNDSKTKFSFAEGAVIQVLKKDASGE